MLRPQKVGVLRQKEGVGDEPETFSGVWCQPGAQVSTMGWGTGGESRRTQAWSSCCMTLGKSFPSLGFSLPSSQGVACHPQAGRGW